MALSDVNFEAGEGQYFIMELEVGTLNAPNDLLVSSDDTALTVNEVEGDEGGGGNIFIMSE